MQKNILKEQIHLVLAIYPRLDNEDGFDKISEKIDHVIQENQSLYTNTEIFLLLKYVSHYLILNERQIPSYLRQNAKEPINSLISDVILDALQSLGAGWTSGAVDHSQPNDLSGNSQIAGSDKQEIYKLHNFIEGLDWQTKQVLLSPIENLDLSVRLVNVLKSLGISNLGEIPNIDFKNLEQFSNAGRKTENELIQFLSKYNLTDLLSIEGASTQPQQAEELSPNPSASANNDFKILVSHDGSELQNFSQNQRTILFLPIAQTGLSVRLQNVLHNLEVLFVGQILCIKYGLLGRLGNVGRKTENELFEYLDKNKLLNKSLSGWPTEKILCTFPEYQSPISRKQVVEPLDSLSDKQLEIALCDISQLDFSIRLENVLRNLGIARIGEVLLAKFCRVLGLNGKIPRTPNYGKKSYNELINFLQTHELTNIELLDWPTEEEIEVLISERKLNIGAKFAISTKNQKTMENEVKYILSTFVEPHHQLPIFRRLGLEEDCIPWGLQEIGSEGFGSGNPVTRERVRQVEAKYLKKLKQTNFSTEKCEKVASFLNNLTFVSRQSFEAFINKEALTRATNPCSLIERLMNMGIIKSSHKLVKISWINGEFFVREDKIALLRETFENLSKKIVGKVFVNLHEVLPTPITPEDKLELITILKDIPNLFTVELNGVVFAAKKAYRLAAHGTNKDGIRTNSLVSVLSIIFSVTKSINFDILYKAITRDRKISEGISKELLIEYLRSCKFLKFEGTKVVCLERSKYDNIQSRDYLLVELAKELNSICMDSTQITQGLIAKGLTSKSAQVLRITSPLVINLKKGQYHTKGIYRLICDIDEIDLISAKATATECPLGGHEQKSWRILTNPQVRATGRSSISDLGLNDGEYQVFDKDDNFVAELRVRGNILMGLKALLDRSDEGELILTFVEDRFICG